MSAATAEISVQDRAGGFLSIPVEASTLIYKGTLVALNASGNAIPAADTAGLRVVGRAEATADNSAGLAAAINVRARRGCFAYTNDGTHPVTEALVGQPCFVLDDQTVGATAGSTNKVKAGYVDSIDPNTLKVWVDTSLHPLGVPTAVALTSGQNATAAATDLTTSEALANALKANYNALQIDVAAILTALQGLGILK